MKNRNKCIFVNLSFRIRMFKMFCNFHKKMNLDFKLANLHAILLFEKKKLYVSYIIYMVVFPFVVLMV